MATKVWEKAWGEFYSQYSELAFPGGWDTAVERILSGNTFAIEAAICFLECRPYFFRSGYMWTRLMRKIKRAPLTETQLGRLQQVFARYRLWLTLRKGRWKGSN